MEIVSDKIDDKLLKELTSLKDMEVIAGITDGEIATYATYNEYGTGVIATSEGSFTGAHIPPRPFMQTAWDNNESKYNELLAKAIDKVIGGSGAELELGKVGAHMSNDIKDSINNGNWTPNSEVTKKIKGSSEPLKDDLAMLKSVHFEVRK